MKLVVGILLIGLGLWSLATNVMSYIERDRLIQSAQQIEIDGIEANTYYVMPIGWVFYLTSIGIPAILLTGGGLLIRDSRWLFPQS